MARPAQPQRPLCQTCTREGGGDLKMSAEDAMQGVALGHGTPGGLPAHGHVAHDFVALCVQALAAQRAHGAVRVVRRVLAWAHPRQPVLLGEDAQEHVTNVLVLDGEVDLSEVPCAQEGAVWRGLSRAATRRVGRWR